MRVEQESFILYVECNTVLFSECVTSKPEKT